MQVANDGMPSVVTWTKFNVVPVSYSFK